MLKFTNRMPNSSGLIDHLKSSDQNKFETLIKYHLTLLLPHLTADLLDTLSISKIEQLSDGSWHPDNKRQTKRRSSLGLLNKLAKRADLVISGETDDIIPGDVRKGVFGAPLTEEGVAQCFQLIDFLKRAENIVQEGLFRKSGSAVRQSDLIILLRHGQSVDLNRSNYFTVHDVATVLKIFLNCLPDALLFGCCFPIYEQIFALVPEINTFSHTELLGTRRKQLKAIQLLFLMLPAAQKNLLTGILTLLTQVIEHSEENKMNAASLGTIFGPILICPKKSTSAELQSSAKWTGSLFEFILRNASRVWSPPRELLADVSHHYSLLHRKETDPFHPTVFKQKDSGTPSAVASGSSSNDPTLVHSSVTFVDPVRSSMANNEDYTSVALAELHAQIQAMPESAQKAKLLKRLRKQNRENVTIQESSSASSSQAPNSPFSARLRSTIRRTFTSRRWPGSLPRLSLTPASRGQPGSASSARSGISGESCLIPLSPAMVDFDADVSRRRIYSRRSCMSVASSRSVKSIQQVNDEAFESDTSLSSADDRTKTDNEVTTTTDDEETTPKVEKVTTRRCSSSASNIVRIEIESSAGSTPLHAKEHRPNQMRLSLAPPKTSPQLPPPMTSSSGIRRSLRKRHSLKPPCEARKQRRLTASPSMVVRVTY